MADSKAKISIDLDTKEALKSFKVLEKQAESFSSAIASNFKASLMGGIHVPHPIERAPKDASSAAAGVPASSQKVNTGSQAHSRSSQISSAGTSKSILKTLSRIGNTVTGIYASTRLIGMAFKGVKSLIPEMNTGLALPIQDAMRDFTNLYQSLFNKIRQGVVKFMVTTNILDHAGRALQVIYDTIAAFASGIWKAIAPTLEKLGKNGEAMEKGLREFSATVTEKTFGFFASVLGLAASTLEVVTGGFSLIQGIISAGFNMIVAAVKGLKSFLSPGAKKSLLAASYASPVGALAGGLGMLHGAQQGAGTKREGGFVKRSDFLNQKVPGLGNAAAVAGGKGNTIADTLRKAAEDLRKFGTDTADKIRNPDAENREKTINGISRLGNASVSFNARDALGGVQQIDRAQLNAQQAMLTELKKNNLILSKGTIKMGAVLQ